MQNKPDRSALIEMIERKKEFIAFDARMAEILERSAIDFQKKSITRRAMITMKRLAANVVDAPSRIIREMFFRQKNVTETRAKARRLANSTMNDFVGKHRTRELVKEGSRREREASLAAFDLSKSNIKRLVAENVNRIIADKIAAEIDERLSNER